MIVVVQGSKSFNDYSVFLRAMGTALHNLKNDDKDFFVYSVGPSVINSFASEFVNVSERGFKSRGLRVKFFKVPAGWAKQNIHSIDYLAYFSKPKEPLSDLVNLADAKDLSVGVYRY
jgi:hypothetical protein